MPIWGYRQKSPNSGTHHATERYRRQESQTLQGIAAGEVRVFRRFDGYAEVRYLATWG